METEGTVCVCVYSYSLALYDMILYITTRLTYPKLFHLLYICNLQPYLFSFHHCFSAFLECVGSLGGSD